MIVPISTSLPLTLSSHAAASAADADPLSPTSKPLCPVCLSEPSAPRMTRCGHVFCYPCLLHYLEVGEESKTQGRKCPVCWDTVLRKDLKSVRWFDAKAEEESHLRSVSAGEEHATNPDSMTFRLIQRPDITTLALPRSSTWPSEAVSLHQTPWHFIPDAMSFAKLLQATPDYMTAELNRDLTELDQEATNLMRWGTQPDDLGLVFIEAAKRKVHEQLEKVATLKTASVMAARKRSMKELAAVEERHKVESQQATARAEAAEMTTTTTDEENDAVNAFVAATRSPFASGLLSPPLPGPPRADDILDAVSSVNAARGKPRRNLNPPAPSDTSYYFYQAASGQQIYLHPLDIRILKAHYGSYSSFPDTLTLPIEGHEDSTMTDELRRKCRYLSHLPTACDVVFVEADLEALVGPKGLEMFAPALKQRRNKRKEKTRKEDKAKLKSEQKEREAMDNLASRMRYSEPMRMPSPAYPQSLNVVPHGGLRTDASGSEAGSPPHAAQFPSTEPPPQLTGPRTVWGTKAVPVAPTPRRGHDHDEDEEEERDYWAEFEEDVVLNQSQRSWRHGRGQNGGGGQVAAGGGTTPPRAGAEDVSANAQTDGGGAGRKKARKKKVVLNLTAGGGRGA